MMAQLLVAVLFCILTISNSEIVRYDGHKVIRVQAANRDQLKWLGKLHDESLLDFWTYPSLIRPTDIRVSPGEFEELNSKLFLHGFNVTILHEDVQKLIESMGQHPHSPDKRQVKLLAETVIGGFPRYDEIYRWATSKQSTNQKIMSIHSIGKTYERRTHYVIKLGLNTGVVKPAIWIDGGIHAREWLAVSTVVNIIDKMLGSYELKDPLVTNLLTTFDWYFLPVANPDGYEYSHTSGARLWRKTRTRYSNGAVGADPNRNWGYHWGTTGISRSPTSSKYCGPYEWSEKCVSNMKSALESLQSRLKVYITLHSYGQMWFVPYAWSRAIYPSDYQKMMSVGRAAASAMYRSTGAVYSVGRVPDLLYEASGSSMDWVKGQLKTEYAFGMELRPTLATRNGFITSTANIRPSAQEVWEALKVVAKQAQSDMN